MLVDERSTDATAALALAPLDTHAHGSRLTVVRGEPLPAGWVGKVWGLEQAYRATGNRDPTTTS